VGPSPATTEPPGSSTSSPRASSRRPRHPNANSASCEAPQGRPRQEARSPYRPRPLARGLGKEHDLRLARGLILRVARGRLVRSPLPPASVNLPTARHVSLILQPLPQSQPNGGSTPQNGRRDPRSHQRHTGQDRARRGLSATVS
jgi:hypothetical protein